MDVCLVAGGFSVFAGVGERTREGNDLYKEMIESVGLPPSFPTSCLIHSVLLQKNAICILSERNFVSQQQGCPCHQLLDVPELRNVIFIVTSDWQGMYTGRGAACLGAVLMVMEVRWSCRV